MSDILLPKLAYIPSKDPRNISVSSVVQSAITSGKAPANLWTLAGPALDQGQTPQCTGYAGRHWLSCNPNPFTDPVPTAETIYKVAQDNDEWAGNNYDGSSILGVAKALQKMALVDKYYFCDNLQQIKDTLLFVGAVMVGIPWYTDMFYPDTLGQVHPGGKLAGGHAFVIQGYRSDTNLFRCVNSWGNFWGKWGNRFTISATDLDALIFHQYGEACIATKMPFPG